MTWLSVILWVLGGVLIIFAVVIGIGLYILWLITSDIDPDDNQLAVYGDGAWPRTTGPYRTGVHLSHPEPADQVPDEDRHVPRLPPDWPGLPPKPKRRAL